MLDCKAIKCEKITTLEIIVFFRNNSPSGGPGTKSEKIKNKKPFSLLITRVFRYTLIIHFRLVLGLAT